MPKTKHLKPTHTVSQLPKALIGLASIGLLILMILVGSNRNTPFDVPILLWLHGHSTPVLNHIFLFITTVGNTEYIVPLTVLISLFLCYRRLRRQSLLVFAGFFGAGVIDMALKLSFQRVRPALWHQIISESSYSFPSGHAMLSSALIICLVVIAWQTRWRLATLLAGITAIILIGLSRIYLGVHYPSDILAGWCASIIWVSVVVCVINTQAARIANTES